MTSRVNLKWCDRQSNGKYKLVDAKYSSVGVISEEGIHKTLTANQKLAYKWIKDGKAKSVVPFGENAKRAKLSPNREIVVDKDIDIIVNDGTELLKKVYKGQ